MLIEPIRVEYISDLCLITCLGMHQFLVGTNCPGTGEAPKVLEALASKHYNTNYMFNNVAL